MSSTAATLILPARPAVLQILASRWLWCLAAVLLPLARIAWTGNHGLDTSLGDTDDATRILQVKALLGGAGWFDTTIAKIGGAVPLVSHWSRLIDAPLAILLGGFSLVVSSDVALTLTRIVWPSLLLVVFFRVLVAEAESRSGMIAGIACLVMAATCLSGLFQFRIGRIDHHNAMILFSLGGLLLLARSLEDPRGAAIAGVSIAVALSIGYEPLALLLPLLCLASLVSVIYVRFLASMAAALAAMVMTLLAALVLTVAPSNWMTATCDALSINMVLLVGCGALGMSLIARHCRHRPLGWRLAALGATGAVAITAYLLPDTACAAGPFGQVSAEAKRVWLPFVRETQSILVEAQSTALLTSAFLMLMGVAVWASITRWRAMRSIESAATAIVVIASIPPALLQLKFVPYASFLGAFAVALRIANLQGGGQITPRVARLGGVIALNQWTMALAAAVLLTSAGIALDGSDDDGAESCYKTANVAPLSATPAGLVMSTANMGPYIAALTPHAVIAAPYHRIDRQIVESFRVYEGPIAEAESRIRASGARYLVHCAKETRAAKAKAGDGTLNGALLSAETPAFLREIPNASPLRDLRMFEIVTATR